MLRSKVTDHIKRNKKTIKQFRKTKKQSNSFFELGFFIFSFLHFRFRTSTHTFTSSYSNQCTLYNCKTTSLFQPLVSLFFYFFPHSSLFLFFFFFSLFFCPLIFSFLLLQVSHFHPRLHFLLFQPMHHLQLQNHILYLHLLVLQIHHQVVLELKNLPMVTKKEKK